MPIPTSFPPDRCGLWVELDEGERAAWLEASSEHRFSHRPFPERTPGRTVELDGTLADSLSGFLCALGEAVNGPGGYFGTSLLGFDDCLFGGFGLDSPYTIIWRNHQASLPGLDSAELLRWIAARTRLEHELADDEQFATMEAAARSGTMTMFDLIVDHIRSVPERSKVSCTLVLG